jgi:phosphatidylserine/phosphatidylglycerophosphate/cardiolipin synthase-like enzyme
MGSSAELLPAAALALLPERAPRRCSCLVGSFSILRPGAGCLFLLTLVVLLFPLLASAVPANSKQQSLDQWRNLTSPPAPPPRVLVKGDHIRFFFNTPTNTIGFAAEWRRLRVPTSGYKINSAILRLDSGLSRALQTEHGWRPVTVIAGAEWRQLTTNLFAALSPPAPGHAFYYQGFLADRLWFRDTNGAPRFVPLGDQPRNILIDRRFSMDETLERLARSVEQYLAQTHPQQSLFLLMPPTSTHFVQPLLLDRKQRQCVWLLPAALYDTAERDLGLTVTAQSLKAFLLDAHGLALLKNPVSSAARLGDLAVQTVVRFLRFPLPRGHKPIPPVHDSAEEGGVAAASTTAEADGVGFSQAAAASAMKRPEGRAPSLVHAPLKSPKALDEPRRPEEGAPHFAAVSTLRSPASPRAASGGMDLATWEHWLDRYTGTRRELGSLSLLLNGEQFFPRLQQAIADATNHISLDMYIFDRDDVGVAVADQLKHRSSELPVKVILDLMGSTSAGLVPPATPLPEDFVPPSSIQSYLRNDSRVQVHPFLNPWFSADHSKVILVDGTQAWLGGMNIGREYRYEWHDLMVELHGPVVSSLEDEFRRDWAHAGPLGDLAYLGTLVNRPNHPASLPGTNAWTAVRLLPTKTAWKPFATAVFGAVHHARSYIYVENSYLFDKKLVRGLVLARARGVDVRVILPRFNDLKAGGRSNLVTANYLIQKGVRVYFYPGMTHVKALLADDWACLGSANLNHLSMRLCQEHNIATSDLAFATRLKRDLFEEDFSRSYELTEPVSVDWLDFVADMVLESF